ncbi:hypothetical protein NP493_816g01029 [Ridgeia piscesae]|uniref:Zinc finger CHCC-type domain-containing protein n=1 Tax=Ridgeia piscesae TaxID=27915 RepID=A0AAD9KME5_RIDPI|nr:hypothetical protein NP493_816g01029 [Ridgeia piscesae]
MAAAIRARSFLKCRVFTVARAISSKAMIPKDEEAEAVTHTGQVYPPGDYRKVRFLNKRKLVNQNFAIDLIREEPVVVCEKRVVASDSGGALGHPKVFINLDGPGVHTCGYSGHRFVLKKNYDEATMGKSITYEEFSKKH